MSYVPNVLKLVVAPPTALWDLHQLVKWRCRALVVRGSHSCSIYDRQTWVYCLFFVLKISGSSLLCTAVFVWMVDTILKDWIMQRIRSTDAGDFIESSASQSDIMWTLLPFAAVGSCFDT